MQKEGFFCRVVVGKLEGAGPHLNVISILQENAADALAVNICAVEALQVGEDITFIFSLQPTVLPGDGVIQELDIRAVAAPQNSTPRQGKRHAHIGAAEHRQKGPNRPGLGSALVDF